MAKRIPEKYISAGAIIAFVIMMGGIGFEIHKAKQWECVKSLDVKTTWEDKIDPSNSTVKTDNTCTHLVRK